MCERDVASVYACVRESKERSEQGQVSRIPSHPPTHLFVRLERIIRYTSERPCADTAVITTYDEGKGKGEGEGEDEGEGEGKGEGRGSGSFDISHDVVL